MDIIHLVLGKANPERMNGVNKVVYELATKQVEAGLKVSVWGIAIDKEKNYGNRNFDTQLFLQQRNPFRVSKQLKTALIHQNWHAIFHLHGGWIPVFSTISKILSQHKIPFVFTPHGAYNTIAMERSYWTKKIYFHLFEKRLLLKTVKIHCIGKSEMIGLSNLFSIPKSILLPYGYENSKVILTTKSSNKNIVFGFIGRLDIYTKGLDTLIEAFEILLNKTPNAKLWIIGDSNEKGNLEQKIKAKNLEQSVLLFGCKFGIEKDLLLSKMDVFVHPSRNEGLPLSVIEAASFGKPCVVTDATNIGDLITEYQAGKTIYKQNSKELEVAMSSLSAIWNNPVAFSKLQQNAITMIQENYNWKRIIERLNKELYRT
ncbi:glycosyltransferase family 4 protein [Flavobacterium collinsii]|uniref:Glycogen synthase n=1 Tax=Flavobacterium collinsii TaxID=1114861 RepID=A0ABN7EQY4_9FLAO|nr:glycosyltransferase [Flavobacterium collinsii]CAA9203069.1 Glycogen synthase [Flavobacterium collinsii]